MSENPNGNDASDIQNTDDIILFGMNDEDIDFENYFIASSKGTYGIAL